jgi:hypothetical protein
MLGFYSRKASELPCGPWDYQDKPCTCGPAAIDERALQGRETCKSLQYDGWWRLKGFPEPADRCRFEGQAALASGDRLGPSAVMNSLKQGSHRGIHIVRGVERIACGASHFVEFDERIKPGGSIMAETLAQLGAA